MKTALLLHGYMDSLTDPTSKGLDGYHHIKKNIFNRTPTDVFIHSWQPELEDTIIDLYHPKVSVFEPQIDFSYIDKERNLDPAGYWRSMNRSPANKFSYFYSLTEGFKIIREYEKEYGDYDIIIKGRFDLGRINRNTSGPGKHNPYAVQCINFDPSLDMGKVYVADWNFFETGPCDMWWYSNSKNMRHFCKFYDVCYNDYMRIGSLFYNLLEDKNDILNAIRILKQFFIDNHLWEKMKPLETYWE